MGEPHAKNLNVPPSGGTPGFPEGERPAPAAPAAAAAEPERRRGCGGCLAKLVLVLVLILAAAGGVLYAVFRWQLSRCEARLAEVRDQVRAEGYPATLEELDAWYAPVPEAENAGVQIERAFKHYVAYEDPQIDWKRLPLEGEGSLGHPGERLPAGAADTMTAYLARSKEAMALVREGVRKRRCRYAVDLTDPSGSPTEGYVAGGEHLSQLRRAVRMLAMEAALRAEEGAGEGAVEPVVAGLRLAATLSEEPQASAQLVASYCRGVLAAALERVLSWGRLKEDELGPLQRLLVEAESPGALSRALAGDRCFGLHAFENPVLAFVRRPDPASDERAVVTLWDELRAGAYVARGRLAEDFEFYASSMSAAVSIAAKPFPERVRLMEKIEAERLLKAAGADGGGRVVLSGGLLSHLSVMAGQEARSAALMRAARTAVAIERFRLATGIRPVKLSTLAPETIEAVPVDPFDGTPLRYVRREKGYMIYSVGPDGREDGGDPAKDIAFEVGR